MKNSGEWGNLRKVIDSVNTKDEKRRRVKKKLKVLLKITYMYFIFNAVSNADINIITFYKRFALIVLILHFSLLKTFLEVKQS